MLSVQRAVRTEGQPSRESVRRWVNAAAEAAADVTVRFVGEAEGLALNDQFRGKKYATNILSFTYTPPPQAAGDLVLCVPVVLREAAEQHKPADAHFAHMVVHGMLHLQGYDHENDQDAEVMEARERHILAALGYPDPYAVANQP